MPAHSSKFVTLPFWLATVVLLSLTVWVAWYVYDVNRVLGEAVEADVVGVEYAQELALGVREIRTHLNRYYATQDMSYLEAIPELDRTAQEWLEKAAGTTRTEIGRSLITKLRAGYAQFQTEFPQIIKLPKEERRLAIDHLREDVFNANIILHADHFLDRKQDLIKDTVQRNNQFARDLILALVALGGSGAAAGAIVGYLWSATLRRTVVQLSVPVHDAVGKLEEVIGPVTVRATPTNFDELQGSLDHISTQVAQVVGRLQRSQREALRAEQLAAVGQMAAGMAHELRNPLTSVKILIQAANERRSLGPRDLVVLEQEVTRLEHLIQTFLDFARPPQAEKQRLDLREVVNDVQRLFQARADRVNSKVIVSLPSQPQWINGDRTQLHQLLLNLMINSLDAIGRGGEIRVELEGTDSESSCDSKSGVLLRVCDDGCGLPQELGERIFEPFVSTKQTGIGMGLSICRRIVEAHGGKISATARQPRGTEVLVELPTVEVTSLVAVT